MDLMFCNVKLIPCVLSLTNGAAETVIYRIFYYINRSSNGRITLRELKRGNLIAAMQHVDKEEDINKVLKYVHMFTILNFLRGNQNVIYRGSYLDTHLRLITYSLRKLEHDNRLSLFLSCFVGE